MRVGVLLLLAAGSLGVADKPDKKTKSAPAADEATKLAGNWTLVAIEAGGRKFPADRVKALRIRVEIRKHLLVITNLRNRQRTLAFTLKAGANPKAIDFRVREGVGKGKTFLGIYALEGDTLKICQETRGGKRPTKFSTRADSRTQLMVLRRAKP
jgi:uncharacterized protein (TIGR03067 family)